MNIPTLADTSPDGDNIKYKSDQLFLFCNFFIQSSIGKVDNNIQSKCQGMGSANFMEMQQRMQRELMSNPDTLRQVLTIGTPILLPSINLCILDVFLTIYSRLCLGA